MRLKLEKINNNTYNVYWNNTVLVGTFEMDCDGFYYFYVSDDPGSWTSYTLRLIADKLDEVNKPFQDVVDKYFNQEKVKDGLVGKTLKFAEKELEGKEYRVVREDITNFVITDDLHLDRLNLEIDNGIITNVYNG
jgi:hypothetical protein